MEIKRFRAPGGGMSDIQPLLDHLDDVARQLTQGLRDRGIVVERDPNMNYEKEADKNENLVRFLKARAKGKTVSGMLFPNQIETLCDIFGQLADDPGRCILCIGAMMCGKTGTAGGTQLAGPIFYLLRGTKYYPVHLLPVRRGHEQQTHHSLAMFQALYQDLRIRVRAVKGKVVSLREYRQDARSIHDLPFVYPDGSIDLARYRAQVIRESLIDHVREIEKGRSMGDWFANLYARRSRKKISPVQNLCLAAKKDGFTVILCIDEPHWGSKREGVQHRMLRNMEREVRDIDDHHTIIAFDATPFQIANSEFHVVNHRLTADYCGPNCWSGLKLDPAVKTKDLSLFTFQEFADEHAIPDFAMIHRGAYATARAYKKFIATWNKTHDTEIDWSWTEYRAEVEATLRKAIHRLILRPRDGRTRGICIRIMKRNDDTKDLIARLNLSERIKVVPYMANSAQISVEDAINYEAPTEPYVVFVTGAARMADFFPQHCSHFFDWTETVSNQIALMQGMFGRACGYGEPRTVIMNERSIKYIRRYVMTDGNYMMKPGPQCSTPVGRRGAPNINIRIGVDKCDDPVIAKIWQEISDRILSRMPYHNGITLTEARKGIDYVPFWSIFNERRLRHIETHYATLTDCSIEPHILRRDEISLSRRNVEMQLAVDPSRAGWGKVGFRDITVWRDKAYRSEGMQVKGKYFYQIGTHNTGRDDKEIGQVQPQLWLEVNKGGYELIAVVMRLQTAVPARNVPGLILAAEEDLWFDHHSEERQLIVVDRKEETMTRRVRRV